MAKNFITIATLNTYGNLLLSNLKTRYEIISKKLNQENIDFINFQEVYTYLALNVLRKGLVSFPFCSYKHSFLGPKGGLVTFSKNPPEKTSYLKLEMPVGSLRSFVSKILIESKGILVIEIDETTIINVHLSSYPNRWQSDTCLNNLSVLQLVKLTNLIQPFKNCPLLIVCGDFNIAKESRLYSYFVNLSGLSDLFAKDSSPTYHQKFLSNRQKSHRVDYIFISKKNFSIYKHNLLFKLPKKIEADKPLYLSNHIGLLAKIVYQ